MGGRKSRQGMTSFDLRPLNRSCLAPPVVTATTYAVMLLLLLASPEASYSLAESFTYSPPQCPKPDDLICTAKKINPQETYMIKVEPHASKETVHHMMVYGCTDIPNHDPVWDCHLGESSNSNYSVCRGGERQILFAWAMDAPTKTLPYGVGIRLSGETGINYVVVQLHYASVFPDGVTDNSGVTVTLTTQRPPMQAGYIVLADYGYIPPQKQAWHVESYCMYNHSYPIYPIGYRTHAHELGYVSAGYRVRGDEWLEIGRMSPQLPETFYEVSNPGMEIRYGDELTSRCTMNSMDRQDLTRIGPTHHDEMCNFYIMYATYHQGLLKTEYCLQETPAYSWVDNFPPDTPFPADASSLKGIPGAEKVLEHFHMTEVV